MKKNIKLLTFAIISYFLIMGSINAASLSLSKSSSTVSVGSTVKITVRPTGFGNGDGAEFSISYDQERFSFVSSSSQCTALNCAIFSDEVATLTFKAKTNGSGKFTASGTYSDGSIESNISGSTSVTVGASNTNTTPNEGKTLSSNNYLSSLKVENHTLTPEFNKDTLEYSLNLPSDTESINIIADKEDKKANIIGTGEVKVSEGINTLEIIVTAENGNKKTYVIKATVEEKDPIKVSLNKKTYTVVRNKDLLTKPENYEEKTITIDGKETPEEAIHRELREEIGVDMQPEQLKPFVKVRYFQPNYPERSGNKTNRLAVTYYYHGNIESISDERNLTEKEKKDGFTVEFCSINQIQEMLNSKKSNNPRRLYFDRELQAVIDYYKERLQVRENTEIMR